MNAIHQAQIKAEATFLDAIEEVITHGAGDSDKHKIQIATAALAEHARLITMADLRQTAESVLIDRLTQEPSPRAPGPDTINGSP